MYPATELKELAERKARLRRTIATTRRQCLADAAVLAKPIALIDRVWAVWRKISPTVKSSIIPLAMLLKQQFGSRQPGSKPEGFVEQALKWLPAVLGAARMFGFARER